MEGTPTLKLINTIIKRKNLTRFSGFFIACFNPFAEMKIKAVFEFKEIVSELFPSK